MAPPDNDIHDSRCAVNHYYASLSDKFAVVVYTVDHVSEVGNVLIGLGRR